MATQSNAELGAQLMENKIALCGTSRCGCAQPCELTSTANRLKYFVKTTSKIIIFLWDHSLNKESRRDSAVQLRARGTAIGEQLWATICRPLLLLHTVLFGQDRFFSDAGLPIPLSSLVLVLQPWRGHRREDCALLRLRFNIPDYCETAHASTERVAEGPQRPAESSISSPAGPYS